MLQPVPIEYVESPAAPLNLPSSAFDVVVCQQGLQFFPDRLYALQEMQRVLKAGGHAAIAVFFSRLRRELSRLVVNGKVIGKMVSNIIIAHA